MTDLYVIEITTASPLPTGFIREEEAESLKVGRHELIYKSFILKNPEGYTRKHFVFVQTPTDSINAVFMHEVLP